MKPLGGFSLREDENVLVAHVHGIWDSDVAIAFSQQFKEEAENLIYDDWAHVVYLDRWQLGTPQIEPVINHLVHWCETNGLTRTAQVLNPNALKEFQLNKMVKNNGKHVIQRFTCETDAFDWLAKEGFSVRQACILGR